MSYCAALKKSETDIKLLEDMSIYESFHNSIKGGYCCVNQRKITCNNIDMNTKYDRSKPSSTFLFMDFNGLYAECLQDNMPYGGFKYIDKENVNEYELNPRKFLDIDTSENANKGYWITVDFDIPDSLKYLTDDLPLAMVNTEKIFASEHTRNIGPKAGMKKLVSGHFSLERYGLHIKLLNFYISLGCIITKVHNIIEFDQKTLFKPYIDHCMMQRKKAVANNDPVSKRLYKLLANALFGKCLQADYKYNTNNTLTEVGERYEKMCGKPFFKNRRWIIKDKVAVVTSTKK